MKIEKIDTTKVIPYELNNKQHSDAAIKKVANSITEFGWTYPLLVDENNILIAGHKRLEAAKLLKLTEVPILRRSDLSEAKKKAYRIIDNKSSEESIWHTENLNIELGILEDFNFDLTPFINIDFNNSILSNNNDREIEKKDVNILSINVECNNEVAQEALFAELSERGYRCHLIG